MQNPVFPMFVGCGRSGTTLFRNIFDAHPDLAVTHEAHFIGPFTSRRQKYDSSAGFDADGFVADLFNDPNFVRQGLSDELIRAEFGSAPPHDFADAVRSVFSTYARLKEKHLYGDKTPGSVSHITAIGEVFPESKFVHIIRDGRAVALSYLERPEWGPQTMLEAAHHWRSRVLKGRSGGGAVGPERYIEVRYEDMVDSPETVTSELCSFLGITYHDEMLRYHESGERFVASTKDPQAFKNLTKPVTKGLRDWRAEMTDRDLVEFESVAGGLLDELGYEATGVRPSTGARVRASLSTMSWQRKRAAALISQRLPRRKRV